MNNSARRLAGQRVLQEKEPNYKQIAYLDARNYSERLTENNYLDGVVKRYLQGQLEWKEVTKVIANENRTNETKRLRMTKGP